MTERPDLAIEMAAGAVRASLAAQLALTGELVSALVAGGGMSKKEAAEMLAKLADTITSSLRKPSGTLEAALVMPIREHAAALRKIAADLEEPAT